MSSAAMKTSRVSGRTMAAQQPHHAARIHLGHRISPAPHRAALRLAAAQPLATVSCRPQSWPRESGSPAQARIVCRAASEPATAPAQSVNWKLISYFALWYAFNIIFNLLNKTTLNVFPKPW